MIVSIDNSSGPMLRRFHVFRDGKYYKTVSTKDSRICGEDFSNCDLGRADTTPFIALVVRTFIVSIVGEWMVYSWMLVPSADGPSTSATVFAPTFARTSLACAIAAIVASSKRLSVASRYPGSHVTIMFFVMLMLYGFHDHGFSSLETGFYRWPMLLTLLFAFLASAFCLKRAYWNGMSFIAVSFSGATFRNCDLSNCYFERCDMTNCDLSKCKLMGASFGNCKWH